MAGLLLRGLSVPGPRSDDKWPLLSPLRESSAEDSGNPDSSQGSCQSHPPCCYSSWDLLHLPTAGNSQLWCSCRAPASCGGHHSGTTQCEWIHQGLFYLGLLCSHLECFKDWREGSSQEHLAKGQPTRCGPVHPILVVTLWAVLFHRWKNCSGTERSLQLTEADLGY